MTCRQRFFRRKLKELRSERMLLQAIINNIAEKCAVAYVGDFYVAYYADYYWVFQRRGMHFRPVGKYATLRFAYIRACNFLDGAAVPFISNRKMA